MNRHWMGGSRKHVADRRVGKVARQQRAFFEERRHNNNNNNNNQHQHAPRAEQPSHDRMGNVPSSSSSSSTSLSSSSTSSLFSLTLPPRQCSMDLLMLRGHEQPATKKRKRDDAQDGLSSEPETDDEAACREDSGSSAGPTHEQGEAVDEPTRPTPSIDVTAEEEDRMGRDWQSGWSLKSRASRVRAEDEGSTLAATWTALADAEVSSSQPSTSETFKVPRPKPKPNYFFSTTAPPLHKVRFFDEGTECTDEEYRKPRWIPGPAPVRRAPPLPAGKHTLAMSYNHSAPSLLFDSFSET